MDMNEELKLTETMYLECNIWCNSAEMENMGIGDGFWRPGIISLNQISLAHEAEHKDGEEATSVYLDYGDTVIIDTPFEVVKKYLQVIGV